MQERVLTSADIVKYKFRSDHAEAPSTRLLPPAGERSTMNPNIELVRLIQQEREANIQADRLARLAQCCHITTFERIARALRGAPAAR
jgi:hypothetical protein